MSASPATGRSVFLSYSGSDRDAVLAFRDQLIQAGLPTFLDSADLPLGRPWRQVLEQALQEAAAVLVFVGARGFGEWQQREVSLALTLQTGRQRGEFPVIPVLLPGSEPQAIFLFDNTWLDLRYEQNTADAIARITRTVTGSPPLRAGQLDPAPQAVEDDRLEAVEALSNVCPYVGLAAFREEDAGLFFGREEFTARLLERVRQKPLVAVVGPSGSGKSSLVRAGLLPILRRQQPPQPTWDIVIHTPGDLPLRSLAHALISLVDRDLSEVARIEEASRLTKVLSEDPDSLADVVRRCLEESRGTDRLLLVVDQFEELFTLASDSQRDAYLAALLAATRRAPLTVVVTLRADFYGRAIQSDRTLSEALAAGGVNLGPLRAAELAAVIEKPAQRVGLQFEEGLSERILRDVLKQPGALPLLEYALMALWRHRRNNILTHSGYEQIGTLSSAIAAQAEVVYGALSEDARLAARSLFLRLVRVARGDEEGTDSRRRATRSEVGEPAWSVAEPFAERSSRLLTISRDTATGEPAVEVAHEALIGHWKRLKDWASEERNFLLWRQDLSLSIEGWKKSGHDAGALLRGVALKEAQGWARRRQGELSLEERQFIRRSVWGRARVHVLAMTAVAFIVLVVLGSIGAFLYSRTDHYQIEYVLAWAPDELRRGSPARWIYSKRTPWAERYLVALGLLGRANEMPRLERSPFLDLADRVEDLSARLSPGWARDYHYSEPPRNLIIALVAGGHVEEAERVIAKTDTTRLSCAESAAVAAFARLGRMGEARVHLARATLAMESESAKDDEGALICLAEAAIRSGDQQAARQALAKAKQRRRVLKTSEIYPAVAHALIEQEWLDDAADLIAVVDFRTADVRAFDLILAGYTKDRSLSEIVGFINTAKLNDVAIQALCDALVENGKTRDAWIVFKRMKPTPHRGGQVIRLIESALRHDDIALAWTVFTDTKTDDVELKIELLASSRRLADAAMAARRLDAYLLEGVAYRLARRGRTDVSVALAAQLDGSDNHRDAIFGSTAEWFVEDGKPEHALDLIPRIKSLPVRDRLLARVVASYLRDGRRDAAEQVARSWGDLPWASFVPAITGEFRRVLRPLAETTDFLAREDDEERRRIEKAAAFGDLLASLGALGMEETADRVIEGVRKDAWLLGDEGARSKLHSALAVALARAHRFRLARIVADEASVPGDRLAAYVIILEEYAFAGSPGLRETVDGHLRFILELPTPRWRGTWGSGGGSSRW